MRYFEVEGDSPREILNQFLIQKNIPEEFVEMEVLEPGSKGVFGIGKKPAKVKIKLNDNEFMKRRAKLYLSDILNKGDFDYHIEVKDNYPDYTLNILTKDSNVLIGKSATTLDSLQYLIDRILHSNDDADIRILVDVDNYRERVIEPLKEKAVRLAQSVKKTGQPAKMPPMATVVRREIHIAAKAIPGISTISHGEGQVKSLTIYSDKKPRGPKREGGREGGRDGNSRGRKPHYNNRDKKSDD
ncbi:MAG: Jag N-terminal domain-containing protein [Deferribacteraceae bacterium]|jgi:spoIIIJ-associated protein|nr:Jag N-terminal domain-containing protein [Deferribacteraceae bacterium]